MIHFTSGSCRAQELDGMLHELLQLRLFQLPGPTFLAQVLLPVLGAAKRKGGRIWVYIVGLKNHT